MELIAINTQDVILASQASWRGDVLHQLGINHTQIEHRYQEPKYTNGSLHEFIEDIARQKALSLSEDHPQSLIIAADQLICIENKILYKPGNRDRAVEQLGLLNGKTHQLICAVAVFYRENIVSGIETAEMKMRDLSLEEIKNYVQRDEPWGCAGSYKIESLGAALFEKIQVNDPTTIIGLPSTKLLDILRQLGFSNLL